MRVPQSDAVKPACKQLFALRECLLPVEQNSAPCRPHRPQLRRSVDNDFFCRQVAREQLPDRLALIPTPLRTAAHGAQRCLAEPQAPSFAPGSANVKSFPSLFIGPRPLTTDAAA